MKLSALAVLSASLFVASSASALPRGNARDGAAERRAPDARELAATGVDFTAIVALDDCSGSLVRWKTSKDTDKAMVLSNGHCYEGGFMDTGTVLVDKPSSRPFSLLTADGQDSLGTLQATRILYGTMTRTDVTLYELDATYADIAQSYGVTALTLSDHHPVAGTPIRVASGYWKKIYSCAIDGFVSKLEEANWIWNDSLRYTQPGCEVIGGTSGSPIIDADTHEVIGINNTGNMDGERCTENNPCEVDPAGNVTVTRGSAYGEETYWFYSCLTDNAIDLSRPGCVLPKPQPHS